MTFKKFINNLINILADDIKKSLDQDIKDNKNTDKSILKINGLFGSSNVLIYSVFRKVFSKSIYIICKDEHEARSVRNDFVEYGIEKTYYFPSVETTPYHNAVIDDSVRSERLEVIQNLINNEKCIVTSSIDTALFNITPKEKLLPYFIKIEKKNNINIENLSQKLIESGYTRVAKVTGFGEFSVRGDIIDIYFSIYKSPVRIDLFDEEIESIKSFDVITQKSVEEIDTIVIPPNKEYVYGEEEIKRAVNIIENISGNKDEKDLLLDKIKNFKCFDGEQFYLNLFYEKASFIKEYLDDGIIIFNEIKSIKKQEETIKYEFNEHYHSTVFKRKPKVHPDNILFGIKDIYEFKNKIIENNFLKNETEKIDLSFDFTGIPVYLGNIELFKNDIKKYTDEDYKIILFGNTEIQCERLRNILKEFNPTTDKFNIGNNELSILPLNIASGFISEKLKIIFINDYEIFGKRKKISKHYYTKRTEVIDSFLDLSPGDFVVHINHGIGKFLGIEKVKSEGMEKEYCSILYADNDKIFIPVEQLNFIQKYISEGYANPKLDKIGAKGWSKTKERVKAKVQELAKELIKIYSFRLNQKGFKFTPDTQWQNEFEAKFPYEETEDQLITLEEVKRDMESNKPMDRLICGDVGFGKTEIAIRASFKAVMSGKQVIVLVPTTILAEQHYETFYERLKGYPINVDMLSRFRSKEEQREIVEKIKNGDIDIIIGTHRLLSNDIVYKNPGLYIIDEEQKFGVKHKEKIKKLRMSIDSLSLTATPIPRTLHMSLANIRNISIINTPPLNRQSVETYVTEFNEEIFKEAAVREIERGGQIFFLYNRIKTIYEMKSFLKQMIPKARIVIAHGRMHEDDLEDVIHNFLNHEYDILLATTIIESGIDMPRVNTIFIDRADKFGLSQLYQLKGRVGRSERKAYAYLFYDNGIALTEDAMKRLRVIAEYTELGSGFKIAMKDLEIRGAGNLLGPEQSGDILAVGFQLYCKLLSEAVSELATEETRELINTKIEPSIELKYKGYIPDTYISDQKQKIEFYKKIAGIIDKEEINDIKSSLADRFGKIPEEMQPLFYISEIKLLCTDLNILEVKEKGNTIELKFLKDNKINFRKLMETIQKSNGNVFLKSNYKESIFVKIKEESMLEEKGEIIKNILLEISEI